jgi:hypothetical protein
MYVPGSDWGCTFFRTILDLLGLLGCLINKEHACREVFSSQHACREVFDTTRFSVKCHRKSVAKDPKMVAIILLLPFFWLNVVALVTVAIGECDELRFSCNTQHLYCNTFDAFAILGECCNNSNCNHYGCANSINCKKLCVARNNILRHDDRVATQCNRNATQLLQSWLLLRRESIATKLLYYHVAYMVAIGGLGYCNLCRLVAIERSFIAMY